MARDFPASGRGTGHRFVAAEFLATRALAALAGSRTEAGDSGTGCHPLDILCDALAREDTLTLEQMMAALPGAAASPDEMIDRHIPELARRLGDRWFEDISSFAEVSIASSRLQRLVREVGQRRESYGKSQDDARALLVVPGAEQHTLGATVAANQLRRNGIFVDMSVGEPITTLQHKVEREGFAMIGLSVGTDESLRSAPAIISAIRKTGRETPVILGGASFADAGGFACDCGADLVTESIPEALEFCDLAATAHAGN